ncbi:hemagglutinin [Xylella fastidiosa subsp. multiplex]|uniref:hemagglutinin n=1 Tax=Xylella fastidiosa TaxID=2371 RepID=UPI0003133F2C|nr:hemagglutinin [Xylella fastidiosa]KAJ4852036.1 hemagglutinin [Xylella fastidiosa subsp. multiplex]MDC6411771.1 hemagglutinin [Xylella fastidiosa subsp. multiplex]MDC6415128.1 hemagglutinin [Xylella fastidiosa subsp. multiplex]MDC6418366.1 hemagglutinin [Xylella fastidiosa subsp. multiplex]MDD0861582.1 hemagglutinin [Xylella fastidiosa subsp. multiplex]
MKVLESEAFSDQKIREYAQQLAGDVPLKESRRKGVYVANLSDGTIVRLRSVSKSNEVTKARWTIVIEDNLSLSNINKAGIEIKFR